MTVVLVLLQLLELIVAITTALVLRLEVFYEAFGILVFK